MAARDQLQDEVFSQEELAKIRAAVRSKYREVSQTATGRFRYPTGKEGGVHLGYDKPYLDQIPDALLASFCGVGNPFLIGPIRSGGAVLDVGCGAGLDLLVAARTVGSAGRVCGIDLTEEMLVKARENIRRSGYGNIEVVRVESEEIPYKNKSFDTVISNGVINLSPRKLQLFREIRRVLKPGGRLQFADIILEQRLPPEAAGTLEAWSQ